MMLHETNKQLISVIQVDQQSLPHASCERVDSLISLLIQYTTVPIPLARMLGLALHTDG